MGSLNLASMAANQSSPEVTFNDNCAALDAALCAILPVNLTNSVSLTNAQYRGSLVFNITTTGASKTLTLPAIERVVFVENNGTLTFTIAVGSSSVSLAANNTALVITDGTTNGLTVTPVGAATIPPLLQTLVQTVTQSGASLAIDHSLGEICDLSLTAGITSVTVSNWFATGTLSRIVLKVSNTGAFGITGWPSGTKWAAGTAPTITSGSGKIDRIVLSTEDGGTTIFGDVVNQNYS